MAESIAWFIMNGVVATTWGTLATFASTVRVVNRVLCGTADLRTAAEPAGASRFAQPHGRVFCIGKLTDGRIALTGNHAHLGRRQLHLREVEQRADEAAEELQAPHAVAAKRSADLCRQRRRYRPREWATPRTELLWGRGAATRVATVLRPVRCLCLRDSPHRKHQEQESLHRFPPGIIVQSRRTPLSQSPPQAKLP